MGQSGVPPVGRSDAWLEFSWTATQSERWFSVIQGTILRILDPLMARALYIQKEILPYAEARSLAFGDEAHLSEEAQAHHQLIVSRRHSNIGAHRLADPPDPRHHRTITGELSGRP